MSALTCLRSHVHATITTLQALDATLDGCLPEDFAAGDLDAAARELGRLECRLDSLIDALGCGFDPEAIGRCPEAVAQR